jgi:adenylate kinase family enzyme
MEHLKNKGKHTFIFAGRSGSGKGTQVILLQEYIKKLYPDDVIYCYYSGDGFRNLINGDTYTSQRARDIMESGKLHPNFLAVWLWGSHFVQNLKGGEHMFLDGCPRAYVEAEAMDSAMKFYNRDKPRVIVIDVSRETSRQRLIDRKREYDTLESIDRRLDWYDTEVLPVIAYYENNPDYTLLKINGEQPIDKVHTDIINSLNLL